MRSCVYLAGVWAVLLFAEGVGRWTSSAVLVCYFLLLRILGLEPRAWHMLGKQSVAVLHLPFLFIFLWDRALLSSFWNPSAGASGVAAVYGRVLWRPTRCSCFFHVFCLWVSLEISSVRSAVCLCLSDGCVTREPCECSEVGEEAWQSAAVRSASPSVCAPALCPTHVHLHFVVFF